MRRMQRVWVLAGLLSLCGCKDHAPTAATKPVAPAKVDAPAKEADLTQVHLTVEAEKRLAIAVAPVERRAMKATRLLGGTIIVPQGGSVSLAAPLAGTVMGPLPHPGSRVKRHQPLARMIASIMSADSSPTNAASDPRPEVLGPADRVALARAQAELAAARAEAQAQIVAAEAAAKTARAQSERAQLLERQNAGSQQAYETAVAAAARAEADLKAAKARFEALAGVHLEQGDTTTLRIDSPFDGIVTALPAQEGMAVPAGAALIEVSAMDPIWLRVPVYAGDVASLNLKEEVHVRPLGANGDKPDAIARAVEAAPAGNPFASSVDLLFELPNPDFRWRPDQRVMVRITTTDATETLTVPWSAIVHDVHGSPWVYARTAPQTYRRQRVEVLEVSGGVASLRRGPTPGTEVVTEGVAELFGTEFGAGK